MSPEIANASNASTLSTDSAFYRSYNSSGMSESSASFSSVSAARKEIIDVTRKHYKEDFESFLLNNLVMTVVPFENYKEDMKNFKSKNSAREQELSELNDQFEKKHKNSLIYPDTFFENVNKRIVFRRRCDSTATSLIPERIFVVDNTVEVSAEPIIEEEQNSNDANDPIIKVKLELSESNLGYVKLQKRLYRKSTVSSTSSYNSHRSSNSTVSSGETFWVRIKEPFGPMDPDLSSKRKLRFKRVRNPKFGRPSATITEDNNLEPVHRYDYNMTPQENAENFVIEFRNTLCMHLGLDPQTLEVSPWRANISCESCSIKYEISSAIDADWPDQLAANWLRRKRNEMRDPNSNCMFQWPSEREILEVRLGKCIILPRHATQKYDKAKEDKFEWEIAFPRAEKFLQATMTHAQTKTYFLLALIHRSFIEPLTKQNGLLLDHVRMFFYWELEKSHVKFPETRMGSKIMDILNTMYHALGTKTLDHYFLGPEKNVFENVPNNGISAAHDQLKNIRHNKVAYFIAALCNLRYTSKEFPKFNFKKLHKLLTEDHLVSQPMSNSHNFKKNLLKAEEDQEWIDLKVLCKVSSDETIRKIRSLKMFIEHFLEVGRMCFVLSQKQLGLAYYLQARDLTTILAEQGLHEGDVEIYKDSIRAACPDL